MNTKTIACVILSMASFATNADEWRIGAGYTFRSPMYGDSAAIGDGTAFGIQYVYDDAIVADLEFFKDQIFEGIKIKDYAAFTLSYRWTADEGLWSIRPFFQGGLSFKEAEQCHSIHEIKASQCNPLVPSPVSLSLGVGFSAGAFEFLLRHTSNAGSSKPNYGQDSILILYRF